MALDSIGPYQFKGILGRGGMGTVYRGSHNDTGELHAIKVLAPTYAHDPHFRGRFESEIKALIQLDHPNIVRLLSYGQEDAMLFFSMELVEGNSLFHMQKNGHRFDWREILKIARDVSLGLRHAHDRGIIHRDLKPGNLLMADSADGQLGLIKITDFGIAKQFGKSLNTGENVLGTMDFMSPEQAKGEPVTFKSDIFSLGTVLFTLLSGSPPFTANSVEESLRNLTRVPAPRVSSVVPNVPKELDELIRRLMAKQPDKRIQTAQALLHQIDEVETKLRDHSEAQTVYPDSNSNDTFDLSAPRTEVKTSLRDVKKSRAQTVGGEPKTVVRPEQSVSASSKVDYFNTVDDQARQRQATGESAADERGILPVTLALVGVLLLGAFGVYQAYKPPSAEALMAQIEENSARPNKVLDEIGLFLKHYPNEERAPKVEELQRIGKAVWLYNSLCNTLTVRSGMKGENRLTKIEEQFLNIVEISEDDPTLASAKMTAFVNIHESSDLDPGDQKCVDAAKSYEIKLLNDARSKILLNVKEIKTAMDKAGKRTDPDSAIEIYESILELYGDIKWGQLPESDEGRALVDKARAVLEATILAKEQAQQLENETEPTADGAAAGDGSATQQDSVADVQPIADKQ